MYSFLAYVLIPAVAITAFMVVFGYFIGLALMRENGTLPERHCDGVSSAKFCLTCFGIPTGALVVLIGIVWGSISLFNVARSEAATDKPNVAAIRLGQVDSKGTGKATSEPRWKREYDQDAAKNANSLFTPYWWGGSDGVHEIQALLDKGGDPNERNEKGETLLIDLSGSTLGSTEKRVATSEILLKAGADINAQDDAGCTAVCMATDVGDYYHLLYLLDAGADPRIGTKNGWTPLALAKADKDPRKVKALEEALAKYPK